MTILGIETTCDETALAIISDDRIVDEVTISQILKHAPYGGVVPDLGAREHLNNLTKFGGEFLTRNNVKLDAIAVASKIGLPPAVQVGEAYANGLANALKVPLIPINHVIAHTWGVFVDPVFTEKPQFPFLALIVSGGHTQILKLTSPIEHEILGTTIDDAIGEAFDKVAHMLGLPYPGGPAVEKAAEKGARLSKPFPIPLKGEDTMNFSFSGLKTAVRVYIEKNMPKEEQYKPYFVADACAEFQRSAFAQINERVAKAIEQTGIQTLVVGGGVAANQSLINALATLYLEKGWDTEKLFVPNIKYCTDNAAVIASYALAVTKEKSKQKFKNRNFIRSS